MSRNIELDKELELERMVGENPGEFSSQNPVVLSCGGIYVPRENKFGKPIKNFYKILHTCNEKYPTKVVVENIYKDVLRDFLRKESLN